MELSSYKSRAVNWLLSFGFGEEIESLKQIQVLYVFGFSGFKKKPQYIY